MRNRKKASASLGIFSGEIADTKISAEVVSSADLLYNGMGDEVEKEKNLPRRKDLRLKQYDYSSKGAYFVTICIKDRKRIFSDIIKPPTPTNEMLPHIVSTFKRFCNKEIGSNVFQRGYIEHIVRDREDYETRAKYIYENPMHWYYDELYAEEWGHGLIPDAFCNTKAKLAINPTTSKNFGGRYGFL